ncbi:hypothetical protein D3C86_1579840 [compost metagenome]
MLCIDLIVTIIGFIITARYGDAEFSIRQVIRSHVTTAKADVANAVGIVAEFVVATAQVDRQLWF